MARYERITVLGEAELVEAMADVPAWKLDGVRLVRAFEFDDFGAAWAFMTRVAVVSELLFHHPDWSNSWNKVEIAITNHDAGGLTELDIEFCRRVDELLI